MGLIRGRFRVAILARTIWLFLQIGGSVLGVMRRALLSGVFGPLIFEKSRDNLWELPSSIGTGVAKGSSTRLEGVSIGFSWGLYWGHREVFSLRAHSSRPCDVDHFCVC